MKIRVTLTAVALVIFLGIFLVRKPTVHPELSLTKVEIINKAKVVRSFKPDKELRFKGTDFSYRDRQVRVTMNIHWFTNSSKPVLVKASEYKVRGQLGDISYPCKRLSEGIWQVEYPLRSDEDLDEMRLIVERSGTVYSLAYPPHTTEPRSDILAILVTNPDLILWADGQRTKLHLIELKEGDTSQFKAVLKKAWFGKGAAVRFQVLVQWGVGHWQKNGKARQWVWTDEYRANPGPYKVVGKIGSRTIAGSRLKGNIWKVDFPLDSPKDFSDLKIFIPGRNRWSTITTVILESEK